MKFILFITFPLLAFNHCFCQSDKNDIPEIRTNVITLKIPDIKPQVSKPISDLIVLDARCDTSSLGRYKAILTKKNYSIVAGRNNANEIGGFIKNYLQVKTGENTDGPVIITVLKKLWLTNELQEDTANIKGTKNANESFLSGVVAKIEFYCSSGDNYIPLYRFDTVYTDTKDISVHAMDYLRDVLIMSVQKLITADFKNVSSTRKKISLNEIVVYSKLQFNIPIVGTDTYKKGVYKTFHEFKMNNPSIINYEIKKDKFSDMIFAKDGNEEYPVRGAWGFCDGKHLYINSANNYFELIKKQNTFIANGVKTLSRNRHIKAANIVGLGLFAGTVGKGNKKITYDLNLKVYELDMDTGELL